MDGMVLGWLAILAVMLLILLGIPVAFALGTVGILAMATIVGFDKAVGQLASAAYGMSSDYMWAVVPMFVAIGSLAAEAGVTAQAFEAARIWVGRIRGGLAMATCVASGIFAACSGSTVANAALFTPLALPEMLKHGYDKKIASGCIAASGAFAALIPPSITMVIYGILTGEPIGKLLIAGFLPGILSVGIYVLGIYLMVIFNPQIAPASQLSATWGEKLRQLKGMWGILLIFLSIMGGIYTGWCTPSAAAALGAAITLILIALKKKFTWPVIKKASLDVVMIHSSLFIIIIGGVLFGRFWVLSGFVVRVSDFIGGLPLSPIFILLLILMVYIIMGCFLDPPSMMVITLPIVYPIITKLGFNGIWFGILMVIMVEIAVITPPVGFNAYVVNAAADGKVELTDVFGGIFPFFVMDLVIVTILILFPEIALWLPNKME